MPGFLCEAKPSLQLLLSYTRLWVSQPKSWGRQSPVWKPSGHHIGQVGCPCHTPGHQKRLTLQLALAGWELEGKQTPRWWVSSRTSRFLGPQWAHSAFPEVEKQRSWDSSDTWKKKKKKWSEHNQVHPWPHMWLTLSILPLLLPLGSGRGITA